MESLAIILIDHMQQIESMHNSNNINSIKKFMISHYVNEFTNDVKSITLTKKSYTAFDIYSFITYLHHADIARILPTLQNFSYKYSDVVSDTACRSGYIHADIRMNEKNDDILKITFTTVINNNKIGEIRVHTEIEKNANDPVIGETTKTQCYDFVTEEIQYVSTKSLIGLTNEADIISGHAFFILKNIFYAYIMNIENMIREKYNEQ